MKILLLAVLAAILISAVCADNDSWSWGGKKEEPPQVSDRRSDTESNQNETVESDRQGRNLHSDQEILSTEGTLDEIIDTILHRSREGRSLDEYGEICADPSVQEALEKGDDVQARNLIREKLCSLGLMQCDVEGKRPFRPPGAAIYGQGGLRPPYGPPRPMHPRPPLPNLGPPRKVGYEGPIISKPFFGGAPGPVYNGPYVDSPPPPSFGATTTFSKPPPGAIIYESKPPGPVFEGVDAPYEFEHLVGQKIQVDHSHTSFGEHHQLSGSQSGFHGKPTIVVNAQGGAASTAAGAGASAGGAGGISPLQQHVHHHFHHIDSAGGKGHALPEVPSHGPLPIGNGISGEIAAVSSTGGFSPALSGGYEYKNEIGHGSSFSGGYGGASGITSGSIGLSNGLSASFGTISDLQSLQHAGLLSHNAVNGLNGVNGAVRPVSNLYENVKPVTEPGLGAYGPAFANTYGPGSSSFGSGGLSSSLSGGLYNGNSGSFHTQSPDYFKKELHIKGADQFNSLSGYGQQNKYVSQQYGGQFGGGQFGGQFGAAADLNAFETSRQHNIDCVCVPYNQCPAADRIGRKEDLILPIDPRNLGSDIEALTDNSNSTVLSGEKDAEDKTVVKREAAEEKVSDEGDGNAADVEPRQGIYGGRPQQCSPGLVCCRRPYQPQQQQQQQQFGRCGTRNAHGITGRIKNPVYVDGDSEFGEYPWQAAILKKDPKESVYVCGGTIIDQLHVITAAHCVKTFGGFDLRIRLGEWDVNHDVEFFPYIERDIVSVHVHPEYYAGTLDNDLAILKLDHPIDFAKNPHISAACLPDKFSDFTGARCWTTGWGKDAFGDYGKYQNILKEVDVPVIGQQQCQNQLRNTRLGYNFRLHPGFICAGGEEGKDACKGDGGGPMVCERNGIWQLIGVVSWGIGCGQVNVPGVYVRVSHYLDWIHQITRNY